MTQNRDAPAYQEYAAALLARLPFRTMTLQDRGLLYTMRLECWVNVRLPNDHNSLAKVLGLGLLTEFDYMPPIGTWTGKLIAKCWGNGLNIICFFEDVTTGKKYQLSAFRHEENVYRTKDDGIDFAEKGIEGQIYLIETKLSSKGKPVWLSASLIDAEV